MAGMIRQNGIAADVPPLSGPSPIDWKPENDQRHVAKCRDLGGFPRVEIVQGKPTWKWPRR